MNLLIVSLIILGIGFILFYFFSKRLNYKIIKDHANIQHYEKVRDKLTVDEEIETPEEIKEYEEDEEYNSVGAIRAMIQLIVGVGVATLVLMFVRVLGGQTYQLIDNTYSNESISPSLFLAFEALETTVYYMPIIVPAVIIGLVLFLVLKSNFTRKK